MAAKTGSDRDASALQPVAAGSIVVGHDGSPDARRSFDIAIELAEKFAAPLVVVRTWSIDTAPQGVLVHDGCVASFDEVSAKVAEMLVEETRTAAERHPAVEVHYRGVLGRPVEVLLTLSSEARMLVVGSRGLGGFKTLMLGSVSEQCVRHASCPVLVVRPQKTA